MQAYEREFEERLRTVERDVRACVTHTFSELAFHHIAGSDDDLQAAINNHAGFWNAVLGGQQAAAFVGMGRLYDRRPDTRSFNYLLTYAEEHVGIFSRAALARRKVAQGLSATDAETYVADAHEVRTGGLNTLRAEFESARMRYDQVVRPIRHEVFAHSGGLSLEERAALFQRLPIRDFERLALWPYLAYEALWHLYMNGREPTLATVPTTIADVLAARPGRHTGTWQHIHSAANTATFLDSVPRPPRPDVQ